MSAEPRAAASAVARADLLRWAAVIAGCVIAFAGACALAPLVPIDPTSGGAAAIAAYALGFAAVGAMTLASGASVPVLGARWLALGVAIAVGLAALGWAGAPASGGLAIAAGAAVVVALLVGGGVAGAVVGGRIQHPGHLSVVAVVSSIADAWSVLSPDGPSAAVAESAPLLSVLALPFPMAGTRAIEPLLGIGDVVFVALYLVVSRRFALGARRTALALALAFVATAAVVVALERAIPALPFLGAAVLLAHREARLPPERDRRTAALGIGVLVALAIAVLVLRR